MSQLASNKKQPDIRFRGFSGDWDEKKILELSETQKLANGVFNDPDKVGCGYKLINVIDMYVDGFILEDKLSLLALDKIEFENNKVKSGDVFFTRSSIVKSGIAFSNVYLGNASDITYDGHLIRLSPDLRYYYPKFLHFSFKNIAVRKQFIASAKTTTMSTIGQKEVGNVKLYIPQLSEQTSIGNFFKQLDDSIALHKRKHQQTQQLKKAILTKLFPQKRQTQPEIRLQGFRGDWGEKRLGDIGDIITGSTPPTDNIENYSFDGMIWVTPTDIKTNRIETSAKKLSKTGQEIARIVPKNSILVTSIASIGKNTILLKKGSFNQQINALVPFDGFNPYFLLTQSSFWSESMKRVAGHGTMQIVNKNTLADIKTIIPKSLEEQTAIGNFFKQLDDTLALQTQQINTLENLKKAFLQKMFV